MSQKTKLIITGTLIVIFIFVLFSQLKIRKSNKKVIEKPVPKKADLVIPKKSSLSKTPEATEEILGLQKKRAELPWGRDPFFFDKPKKIYESQTLVLKGITLGENGKNYAFINNEIVTIGDVVQGYKVIEIRRNKVLLRKGLDNFYLALPEE